MATRITVHVRNFDLRVAGRKLQLLWHVPAKVDLPYRGEIAIMVMVGDGLMATSRRIRCP